MLAYIEELNFDDNIFFH